MKSKPDFYSQPRDGWIAEELVCDDPSSHLGINPSTCAQGSVGHRVPCGELRRAKSEGGEPWAFMCPKASIDRIACDEQRRVERSQDG